MQEGFGISASIDFDLTDSIFVKNTIELTSTAENTILRNLDLVLPKPLFIENNKTTVGNGDDTTLEATLTITVDNDAASTALSEIGEDPADYDENFCFIENQ